MNEKIIKDLKKKILTVASNAKEGHIPSAFSILDVLWVLYDRILKYDGLSFYVEELAEKLNDLLN